MKQQLAGGSTERGRVLDSPPSRRPRSLPERLAQRGVLQALEFLLARLHVGQLTGHVAAEARN